jgi:DNA mismatch endonuclease, patch repair protein
MLNGKARPNAQAGSSRGKDRVSKSQRSSIMRQVKGRNNRSTERRFAASLAAHGIRGWTRGTKDLQGHPDIVFRSERVAIFLDGCFWHGCPQCDKQLPYNNFGYWKAKISRNVRRDLVVTRSLRRCGWTVIRIWEHDLRNQLPLAVARLAGLAPLLRSNAVIRELKIKPRSAPRRKRDLP